MTRRKEITGKRGGEGAREYIQHEKKRGWKGEPGIATSVGREKGKKGGVEWGVCVDDTLYPAGGDHMSGPITTSRFRVMVPVSSGLRAVFPRRGNHGAPLPG